MLMTEEIRKDHHDARTVNGMAWFSPANEKAIGEARPLPSAWRGRLFIVLGVVVLAAAFILEARHASTLSTATTMAPAYGPPPR